MELKEGKMTLKELSQWFGLAPDTLSKRKKSKEKRLKQLKNYCDYHFEGKTLIIDKVIIPEYSKVYEIVTKEYLKLWGKGRTKIIEEQNIDTCTRVAKAIWECHPEIHNQIKLTTLIQYVQRIKKEEWGKNASPAPGPKGYAEYVYMTEDKSGPLVGEELDKFYECLSKVLDESFRKDQMLGLIEDFNQGHISEQDLQEGLLYLTQKLDYWEIREAVEDELGYYPTKETKLLENVFNNFHQDYDF